MYRLELRRKRPDLFEKACEVDRQLRAKRGGLKKDAVWLHPARVPLEQAVGEQFALWPDDNCEGGYCMT